MCSCDQYISFVLQVKWQRLWAAIQVQAADAVNHVESTKLLTAASQASILNVCTKLHSSPTVAPAV
jgi:hypothetical protein